MIKACSWRWFLGSCAAVAFLPAASAAAQQAAPTQEAYIQVQPAAPQQPQVIEQSEIPPPPPGGQQEIIVIPTQPVPMPEAYAAQDPYRLQTLERRLAELRAQRSQYGIGGPITMMGVGGGLLLFGGSFAWIFWSLDGDPYSTDYGYDNHKLAVAFTTVAAVGGALFIVGTIKLPHRLRMRRQFNPEIRQIQQEIRTIREQQRQGPPPGYYGGYGASLDFGLSPGGIAARLTF